MILTKEQTYAVDRAFIKRGADDLTWLRDEHPGIAREVAEIALLLATKVRAELEGDAETLIAVRPFLAARATEMTQVAYGEVKS